MLLGAMVALCLGGGCGGEDSDTSPTISSESAALNAAHRFTTAIGERKIQKACSMMTPVMQSTYTIGVHCVLGPLGRPDDWLLLPVGDVRVRDGEATVFYDLYRQRYREARNLKYSARNFDLNDKNDTAASAVVKSVSAIKAGSDWEISGFKAEVP